MADYHPAHAQALPVRSEEIEPFFARIIGRLGARVEHARRHNGDIESACHDLWYAVRGLEKVVIAVKTATHCSVVM